MDRRQVVRDNEIYLASFDPDTGQRQREGRFKLSGPIRPVLTGLFPPVIAINEDGRDTQPFLSSDTIRDVTGGLGIKYQDQSGNLGRYYFATVDTRYSRNVVLNRRKVERANATAGSRTPRAGGAFNNKTWVAFDEQIYSHDDTTGWTLVHTLGAGAYPRTDPLIWGNYQYWFLGTDGIVYSDGATFTAVAKSAEAGVVIGDVLWIVDATGAVSKTAVNPPAVADFTSVTSVNATQITGMLAYLNASNAVVPFVVTSRALYAIDPDTNTSAQAGPTFHPSLWPLRAEVLTADHQVYLGQGMDVIAWDGDTAQNVGLNRDDGVPGEYSGGIRKLINGNTSLFALVDNTYGSPLTPSDIYSGEPYRDMLEPGEGYAVLYSREASGWHVRAVSDVAVSEATLLFISDAHDEYRLWFAWGGACYTIDLQRHFHNPLDDAEGDFEGEGFILYPYLDFGYHEDQKIGLLIQCRTRNCSADQVVKLYARFDEAETWYELRNSDGTHGITTNGRHSFRLHASMIPTSVAPLTFADEPGVGFAHDNIQLKAVLSTDDSLTSPALMWVTVHVQKVIKPLMAWNVTLDLRETYHGLTPYQQYKLLEQFMRDQASGLLHLTFFNVETDGEHVYAVKVSGNQGAHSTGLVANFAGQVALTFTEVLQDG